MTLHGRTMAGAVVLAALAFPTAALPCVCEEIVPFERVARAADDVVIARVVRHTDPMDPYQSERFFAMELEVMKILKGDAPRRVKVWGGLSSCHGDVSAFADGSVVALILLKADADPARPDIKYVLRSCLESTRPLSDHPRTREFQISSLRAKAGL